MNRLWVRLSVAFSAVVMLGVATLILASVLIAQSGIRETIVLDELRSPGSFVDQLTSYYEQHGSWDDLEEYLLRNNGEFTLVPRLGLSLLVLNREGRIVYSNPRNVIDQPRDLDSLHAIVPILVQGETSGYLSVEEPPLALPQGQARLVLEGLSKGLLLVALVGGVLGVVFGVLMSRSLTAPLNRLAEAARAIGAQHLSRRVKVEGTTEVAELASAFNEMAAALEQTEKLRRDLVADVAHELRTPLSVLQGNLLAILDDVYPLEKSEVARLYDQTRLLSRLVDDLHELSQAEAKQLPLNLRPVDVGDLVDKTVATFGPLAESEGVKLGVDVPDHLPFVQADSARLTQVLHNLLNNALVHTQEGGQISIGAAQKSNRFILSIRDTGQGIPAEHLPYIFERFYRIDRARNRNTGGMGLGLAIVKAIVEAHGGVVSVVSEGKPGKGSTFSVELPLIETPNEVEQEILVEGVRII